MQQATTEWVAMIDSDVTIPCDWFQKVEKHITQNCGAIATVAQQADPHIAAYDYAVNLIYPLTRVDTAPHINNVLIRKKLMLTYNPPPCFFGEDHALKLHVTSHGYEWKVIPSIGAKHLGTISNSVQLGIAYKRYYSKYQVARRLLARSIFIPVAGLVSLSPRAFLRLTTDNINFIAGWVIG